jgi:isoamylase/glycogen operon protein
MIEKLSHLKRLGVTALELMPIYEFDESEWVRTNPVTKKPLYNYWGYSPLQFFCPMQRYGTTSDPATTAHELKQLVQACHNENISVILDVVYNHTGEGNEYGPAYSFKALAEDVYYLKDHDRRFANYTGCGNTLQANHPVVIDLIIQSLRHWVTEYRIDGFRFDLASALTRDSKGRPLAMSSPLEAIIHDPIVGKCILIVEPWDASGLYQTGNLFELNQQQRPAFLEWNDKFRDEVRIFFTGAPNATGKFATRLCGSEDIYGSTGSPKNSVNYITSHDGFSLYDLVSYHSKCNLENGEDNRDGMSQNHSWNCGHEGPTKNPTILHLRARQVKNMFVALFLAQGVPMFLMGDECYTTKEGNNNAWCQDSNLNWLSWNAIEEHEELSSFISTLISLRKNSHCFDKNRFLSPDDIEWHGRKLGLPSWENDDHLVAFCLKDHEGKPSLFIAFNGSSKEEHVEVPGNGPWHLVIDTSRPAKKDCFSIENGHKVQQQIRVGPHASIVLCYRC